MQRNLKIYWEYTKVGFRQRMIYRSAFFLGIIGQWIGYGATYASMYIMVTSFGTLDGWNASEIMFLYGFSTLSYSLGASFFFNPCIHLSQKIRTGLFDQSLTKPISPFFHEMCQEGFNSGYVSHVTLAIVIMTFALENLRYNLTWTSVFLMLPMLIGAALIQAASLIAASSASFFFVNENPVMRFLLFEIKQFTNYPITIFPRPIEILLTFILPFAFINFYPAALFFSKNLPEGFPMRLPYLTPVIGVMVFLLSILLWNQGLKHYKSSGS